MAAQFRVRCTATEFPPGVISGNYLTFSEGDLTHALFATGRAPGDRFGYGAASRWEWQHKRALLHAYVRCSPSGGLYRSSLADSLDRSEKSVLSYALGQAMAGIFATQKLGVAYLMHIDRYRLAYNVRFSGTSNSRPDFFGMTRGGDWAVAEAKGRSNAAESGLLQKVKDQSGMVKSIGGSKPLHAFGCISHFPSAASSWVTGNIRGAMQVRAIDPKPDQEAVDYDIDSDKFLWAYYSPFVSLLQEEESTRGLDWDGIAGYVISQSMDGVRVGMASPLYEFFRDSERVGSPLPDDVAVLTALQLSDIKATFADGTIVLDDWADTILLRDYEG